MHAKSHKQYSKDQDALDGGDRMVKKRKIDHHRVVYHLQEPIEPQRAEIIEVVEVLSNNLNVSQEYLRQLQTMQQN
jgi:hypothetical protein